MNFVLWCVIYCILFSAFPGHCIATQPCIRLILIMLGIRSRDPHNSNRTPGVGVSLSFDLLIANFSYYYITFYYL